MRFDKLSKIFFKQEAKDLLKELVDEEGDLKILIESTVEYFQETSELIDAQLCMNMLFEFGVRYYQKTNIENKILYYRLYDKFLNNLGLVKDKEFIVKTKDIFEMANIKNLEQK